MFRWLVPVSLAFALLPALACKDQEAPAPPSPAVEPEGSAAPAGGRYAPYNFQYSRPTTDHNGNPYNGPFFVIPEDWPAQVPPPPADRPWEKYSEITQENVNDFMIDMRNWVLATMLPVDWRVQDQAAQQRWYSGPWMPRETVRGMYDGNNQPAGSYGPEQTDCAINYTVDFYSPIGGYTFGQVWGNPQRSVFDADVAKGQFPADTVVVKLAMTSLPLEQAPTLKNAPSWWIYTPKVTATPDCATTTPGELEWIEVRAVQMDVVVKSQRLSPQVGWVFGTLAYNQDADPRGWDESRPEWKPWYMSSAIGAAWGNDPGVTPGNPLQQSMIYPKISSANRALLGYGGRVSGPIDGGQPQAGATPGSACLSCHSTAQVSADTIQANFALLVPPENCPEDQLMQWFQNNPGTQPFAPPACSQVTPPAAGYIATDYDFVIAAGASHAKQGGQNKSFAQMKRFVGVH